MDIGSIAKALIVKPSSLGDIVHSLPFLASLKRTHPNAMVHWVVARGLEGLLDSHPMVDRLWIIDKDKWKRISNMPGTIREFGALMTGLAREKYDIAIDLQGLFRSGLIAKVSQAPTRVGFSDAREMSPIFYNRMVAGGLDSHAVDRYMKVASNLGFDTSKIEFPILTSPYDTGESDYAVLVPGARWDTKIWPASRFSELAAKLQIKTFILGGSTDTIRADEIVAASKGNSTSLAGKTSLKELAHVIKGARFMVCNDSGPMHIAAGFGVPVFAIFGPTNPERTGPYGSGHTVFQSSIDCVPCYRKGCNDLKCMKAVSPDEVLGAIKLRGLA